MLAVLDDRLVGMAELAVERFAKRGILLPALLREAITGLAAAALIHFVSILSVYPDLAILFLAFACLYFRKALTEWRSHDRAARSDWSPELANSYRARARAMRDAFRTGRTLSLFVLFFCLAYLAGTIAQGVDLSELSAMLLIILINLRNYLECAEPSDPDARSWQSVSAPQGT